MNHNSLKARVSRKASPTWLMVSYCSLLLTADPRAQVATHGWNWSVCVSLPIFGLEVYPTCVFLVCAHARSVSHTFACEYINIQVYIYARIHIRVCICLFVCMYLRRGRGTRRCAAIDGPATQLDCSRGERLAASSESLAANACTCVHCTVGCSWQWESERVRYCLGLPV